jgi:hypothetical protein
VRKRCGAWHGMPRASSFPAGEWPTVIQWMNDVLRSTGGVGYEADELARFDIRAPLSLWSRR